LQMRYEVEEDESVREEIRDALKGTA
jgi:hypothetical protein